MVLKSLFSVHLEKELIDKYGDLTGNLHTDLHECFRTWVW